jgi:hypothetical protein
MLKTISCGVLTSLKSSTYRQNVRLGLSFVAAWQKTVLSILHDPTVLHLIQRISLSIQQPTILK